MKAKRSKKTDKSTNQRTDDFYDTEYIHDAVEDELISGAEGGFMIGYIGHWLRPPIGSIGIFANQDTGDISQDHWMNPMNGEVIEMKTNTEDAQTNNLEKDDLQDNKDFFNKSYIDFFPKEFIL